LQFIRGFIANSAQQGDARRRLQAPRNVRTFLGMTDRIRIAPASGTEDLEALAGLFRGYAASLPVDLGYQDFDAEMAALPGKYAPPLGALLLARDAAGAALGCVGLRPLAEDGVCEMKRLYLLPAARGLGLGRALADAVVGEARRLGYRELRLDTLPSMARAIAMYEAMGFARIEPYYAPTPPGTVFMALTL
jgi:ribosomal protein S18 acetylase RimI-like enzyme